MELNIWKRKTLENTVMLDWTQMYMDESVSNDTQQQGAHLVLRSWFLKYNSSLKGTRAPWKNSGFYCRG